MKRFFWHCSVVFLALTICACHRDPAAKMKEPPATPVLSHTRSWALVTASYAQVFDIPASTGVVLGYYRKEEIIPVTERKKEILKDMEIAWLKNSGKETGWIKESDVLVFDSQEKAATAARTMGK